MIVKNIKQATVIGAGSWGTTIADILAKNVPDVVLWGRDQKDIDFINSDRINHRFLPNLKLPKNLRATSDYSEAFDGSRLFVWAIPVQYTRERLKDCASWFPPSSIVVNLSKGLENGSWYRPSQIIAQECKEIACVGTLGGPNLAAEISAGKPASAALAFDNHWELAGLESLFTSKNFSVALSPHIIAIEVAGALKNIIAIAAGICDGAELGWNIKSSVITKGFAEMQLIGCALGANKDSFTSLFALGDLIATCGSASSRNRMLGERIGRGDTLEQAKLSLNGRVAEGVATTFACREFSEKIGLELPLMYQIHEVLVNGLNLKKLVASAL